MEARLFVGNLSYGTTEQQLRELFTQAGTIKDATVVTERETGRSKGFGFVEMATAEDAQKAIEMFNGYALDNRPLTVNLARPREERSSSGPRGGARSDFGGSGGRGGYGGRSRGGGGNRGEAHDRY
jgi:RNA recognition motif-containing protein